MLNALTRKKKLARVSATPGRTRALQFFDVTYRPTPAARPRRVRLCDLPGYGYAKVSRAERQAWGAMIEDYLKERDTLRAVVLIVDARHEPSESDADALDFLRSAGREVVIAATKIDKLSKADRAPALVRTAKALGLERAAVVPFSAIEGTGSDALWSRLAEIAEAGGQGEG
jgi:GTP-binding protein